MTLTTPADEYGHELKPTRAPTLHLRSLPDSRPRLARAPSNMTPASPVPVDCGPTAAGGGASAAHVRRCRRACWRGPAVRFPDRQQSDKLRHRRSRLNNDAAAHSWEENDPTRIPVPRTSNAVAAVRQMAACAPTGSRNSLPTPSSAHSASELPAQPA